VSLDAWWEPAYEVAGTRATTFFGDVSYAPFITPHWQLAFEPAWVVNSYRDGTF
jgi:hypothetical protein